MKIDILGVQVDNLTFAQVLGRVEELLADGRPHYIVTPYAESIVVAQKDEEFRRIINQADLAVPDGVSLLMAAKYLREAAKPSPEAAASHAAGTCGVPPRTVGQANEPRHHASPRGRLGLGHLKLLFLGVKAGFSVIFQRRFLEVIPEEVKGTDLMLALCKRAARKGWRVFLLGGWNGVGERAVERLKEQYSNIAIESTAGCIDVERESEAGWAQVKERLRQFQPDLLFVSYGPVAQEKWIAKNLEQLSSKVVVGVAGAFDMLAGRKPRAPSFLRRCGLEWLWRLLIEPSRLPRIFRAVVVFPWLVFRSVCR